ncbi:MAG: MdtA/MuxA family multidrug efflux RND transporter periplasmic adaptor subunit [Gammaproteobacteria bacterium]
METSKLSKSHDDDRETNNANQNEPFYRKTNFWLIVLALLVLIILIQHWPFGKKKKTPPPVPVVVATAQTTDVPVYLSELGAVTPTYTVTVRTQINGQLLRVLYKEGQMVKKGELLAEIDPRPYQAQLTQYQGQLLHDQALLANAQLDLKRYQTLWRQDSVSKQTLDTQAALVKQYMGTVKSDEGQIQAIQVNLIYCEIKSPVDGRVGLRLVDPGNFVQTSDTTGLAVIATLQPITVIFSIPEDNIPEVLAQIEAGHELTVNAYDRQQTKLLAVGKLLTIDNQIDPTTGMVKLRAQFANENNTLFPSQFVNAQLLVETLHNAIVVPTAAIQHGVQNNYVYVVNDDKTVSVKSVVTGVVSGQNTVIKSGLTTGQVVVTEGTDKLADGLTVSTSDQKQSAAKQASSTQGSAKQ